MEILTILTHNDVKITVTRHQATLFLEPLYRVECECLRCGDREQMFVSESQGAAIQNALFLAGIFNDMDVERQCRPSLPVPQAPLTYLN